MGQALRGVPEAPSLSAAKEDAPFSIGAYLARQRSLRGVSLEELEVATRIPRRSLERLEAGAFDRDRDAFARSFVRTVAQALGLDVHDTITRMSGEVRPRRHSRGAALLRSRGLRAVALLLVLAAGGIAAARWAAGGFALPAIRVSAGPERAIVARPDPVRALAHEARVRAALSRPEPAAPPSTPETP
jgi:hypothetical protein